MGIQCKTSRHYQFILKELAGHAVETAKHRSGCRILSRLLEHSSSDERTAQLVEELLGAVGDLTRHEFGHHVIESVLEHGVEMHKRQIYLALEHEAPLNVRDRNALFVLDRAMKQGTPGERVRLGVALRSQPETSEALNDPDLALH